MPGNHKLFNRAQAKWELLFKESQFSVPAEIGKTAIISSFFTDEPLYTETGLTELEAFRAEARELAARTHAHGGKPELAIDASRDDITQLIQDPDIASMYIIGNGSLSNLLLDVKDYYDWTHVSEASTHLKQGKFVQRQCGGLTRMFNAPLGLFAVSDRRNIYAAFNDPSFYPLSLDDPINDKIKPVFFDDLVTYDMIKAFGSVISHEVSSWRIE